MITKPINSIYLVSELFPSGPINQGLNIVSSFNPEKVNAIVVTLFDERPESWMYKFQDKNIEVVQLHSSRRKIFEAKKHLLKIIKDRNIDLVHSSGFSADLVNSMLGKHVTTVSTFRSHISDLAERANVLTKIISRSFFRYSMHQIDTIVGCSKSLAQDMASDIRRKCEMVQNGADVDHYKPLDDQQKYSLREQLGIPTNTIAYVSVGALEPRKNMALIIKAFNELRKDHIMLFIVGEGDERKELESLIGNNNNIKLIGKLNDPLPYYQASDFLISSSLAEGLPNTVLEGMSCGLPCLLSDIRPHFEILEYNSNAGKTFNRYSPDKLTTLIKESLDWNRQKFSEAARELIEKNLSKYCMAENYVKLYKHAIESKQSRKSK